MGSLLYIILAIVVLLVILSFRHKTTRRKPFSGLAGLAFAFILAGIIFGEERELGYSLMAIGAILAIVDIIDRSKRR